ncbi:hypothetical protein FAM09_02790 [Niastella caeni]|uniref:beta-galactosidase n=1 Tax=Niastella caeni TaxID=2569763 RepID=A0A4S8I1I1_9BACT|nr:glycoside hydrolase family 2 TIM barrel-domain containing protein [Niastella caeni]THU41059.1 hypothetical protein FAM09_02790 [Niastella caeni]
MKKTILHFLIMHGILAQALAQGSATPQHLGTDKDHSSLWGLYGSNDRANNNFKTKIPLPGSLGQQGLGNNYAGTVANNRVFDSYIERVTIDAKASGNFTMQVFSKNIQSGQSIEFQVLDPNGKPLADPVPVTAADNAEVKKEFSMIRTWNPENPHLYTAVLTLKDASHQVLYTFTKKFGFRTVESKPDGIYVNGVKVIFKGINRKSADLGNARTSEEAYLADINTMKDLNMNAVRLSYYPVDPHYFDLCDSIGLFVISELTGPDPKKMIKDVVFSGLNHPSVVCWSTGVEHASNKELDKEFATYDVQNRYVMHPVNKSGDKKNSDFNSVANSILYGTEAFIPTEIGNGIYNGGRAAGLEEFWAEASKSSKFSGSFLTSYKDENGIESVSGFDPKSKEKWASYYTIKEIWAPMSFDISSISSSFNGTLNVENKFLYTNLSRLKFTYKLALFPKATQKTLDPLIIEEGTVASPYTGPGEKGQLKFNFQNPFIHADALVLTAVDRNDKEIFTWTFPIRKPEDVVKTSPEVASISTIMLTEDDAFLSLVCDGINYIFDKKSGNITKVYVGKRDLPFNGPFLAGINNGYSLADFKHLVKDNTHTVEAIYKGENSLSVKWTFHTGDLPKMEYQYSMKSPGEYVGITFKYPEEKIVGMKWMGRGPFQVWKNRLKGQQLGVWEKANRNNAEFKGWHADIYWIQFQTNMGNFTFYTDQQNMFLQMFSPLKQGAALLNEFSKEPFPDNGNIGFMHQISGLGTKPGEKEVASKSLKSANEQLSGTIYFDFRW